MKRFEDNTTDNSPFLDEILVRCPSCVKTAKIFGRGKLVCGSCGLNIKQTLTTPVHGDRTFVEGDRIWYGGYTGYQSLGCPKCGGLSPRRKFTSAPGKSPPEMKAIKCEGCGDESAYKINWTPSLSTDDTRDPFFGLPLNLVERVGSKVVWAYNKEHCQLCIEYFSADLRERPADVKGKNQSKKTLFSTMPAWMKSAKNRDKVVKAFKKLAAK